MNDFVDTFRRNLKSGAAAFEKGDQSVYLHALDVTGQMLATLCQHDQVELALLLELEWYALVKRCPLAPLHQAIQTPLHLLHRTLFYSATLK